MVATVTSLTSASATVHYFEADGYYAKHSPEHRKASAWHGRGAEVLGLRRHVRPRRFQSVLEGRVPGTGLRLGRIRDGRHEHRPGVDITLSAPKSVSLAALVQGDRRVRRAHDRAVRATVDWVEDELLQTRSYDPATGRRPRVKANGAVVALFRHEVSRNLDPQLHTHGVVVNMTRNAEGEWCSVEPTALFRNRKLIGAYYRNELARRLRRLGYGIVPTLIGSVPGFEIAGYAQAVLDAFSTRRRDILAALSRWGVAYSAAQAQRAALFTRARKEEPERESLSARWRARAAELGLAVAEPGAKWRTRQRAVAPGMPAEPGPLPALEIVWRAVKHVEERATVFPASEVRAVALGHAPGGYGLDAFDAAMAQMVRDGHLVETPRRGTDLAFVTEHALRAERGIVAWMREGADTRGALMAEPAFEARLEAATLTAGQRDAVRKILLSGDRLVGVQGSAGADKTTMLRTLAALLPERRLLGLAPSTGATRVLARETGIEAATLQWFLARFGDTGDDRAMRAARRAFAGAVIIVDEASMIGTVQMETLMEIVGRLEPARLVLVGDTRQLRSVEAGQPFRLLQEAGMDLAVMDEILRQRDADLLAAVRHAQAGRPGVAIEGLGEEVHEAPPEALGETAARFWLALTPQRRARTAILAPTHALRAQINAVVREGLIGEGVLHGAVLEIERLIDRRMTRVQTADLHNYHAGDAVVFHRDAYGCRAGDIYAIAGTSEGWVLIDDAERRRRRFRPSGNSSRYLAVFETAPIELRAGDEIRWTRNRTRGRRSGPGRGPDLVNGEQATLLAIDSRRVHFLTQHGRRISLQRGDPQLRHIDHAYSITVHGAQGRTYESVIAVLDSGHGSLTNQSSFYVELSRASDEFVLLTDNTEQLVETLEANTGMGMGALEAIGETPTRAAAHRDAEAVRALEREWHRLVERARSDRTIPWRVQGYAETVQRTQAYAETADLPIDLRRFLTELLDHHAASLARERRIGALLGRVDAHCRAWPALAWAAGERDCALAALPAHAPWRTQGQALLADGRAIFADEACAPHLEARERAGEGGMDAVASALEGVRMRDEFEQLRRLCDAIEARAEDKGTIALYDEDYPQARTRVQALATEAELADDLHAPVEAWRARDRAWHEQRRAVEEYPARVQRLVEQGQALAAETRTSPDGDASRTQWRRDCRQARRQAERMLADEDDIHHPHLDVREDARKGIECALALLAEALLRDDYERLHRLGEALRARAANDGASASRDGEDAGWRARVEALAEDPGLPRDLQTPVPILARQARERAPETDGRPLQADFQPVTSDEPAYEESDTTVARNGKPGRPSTPAEAQRLAQEHLEGDKSTGRRALRELILEMGEQRLLGKRYQDPHDIQARLIPRAEDQSTDGERVDVYDFAAVQTDRSAGIAATIIVRHTDAIARERDDAPAANTVGQWRRRARECADEVIAAILPHETEYWANRVGQGARETTQQPVLSLQAEPESAPERVNEATGGHEARQRGTVSESGTIRAPTPAPRVEVEAAKPTPAPAVQALPVPARDLPQPRPASPVTVEVPKPVPAAPVRTTPVPARDLPQPRPGPRLEVEAPKPVPAARVQAPPVPAHHLPQPTPATPLPASPMAAHRLPQPRRAPRVETGLEAADVQHAREALQARLPGKADEIARNRLHPRDSGTTTGPRTAIGAAHEPLAEVCLTEASARAAGEILDTALDAIARRPSRGAAESKGDRLGRSEGQAGKEALYEWRLSAADIVARMIDVACIAEAIETRRRRREEHARSAARTDLNAEAERGRPLERSPSHGSKRGYGGYKR